MGDRSSGEERNGFWRGPLGERLFGGIVFVLNKGEREKGNKGELRFFIVFGFYGKLLGRIWILFLCEIHF
jgi:hypothetical protein